MDDDQIDVKQDAGEEASIPDSSTEEPKASGEAGTQPTEPEATAEGDIGETGAQTEEAPKKGANARIRELNAKAKSAEERAKSLEEKIAELTGSVEPQAPPAPYTPQVTPGQEIDVETYKQEILKSADALVNLRVKQSEATQRIKLEASQLMAQYPELDPDSDSFDKELSDSVTEATLAHVQANPYTASPKKIVEKLMKPYKRAVTKEVGKATENIAKQVSSAAQRPTAVSTKGEKPDSELSIKELEKKYGIHY